jgi:hypothetical protein
MAEQKQEMCEDCRHFAPKSGEKFFNCTKGEHSGVKYGAQVRADTRGCQGFDPR